MGCNFVVGVDGAVGAFFRKGLDLGGTEALQLADMPGIGRVGYLLDPDGNIFDSSRRSCLTAPMRWEGNASIEM